MCKIFYEISSNYPHCSNCPSRSVFWLSFLMCPLCVLTVKASDSPPPVLCPERSHCSVLEQSSLFCLRVTLPLLCPHAVPTVLSSCRSSLFCPPTVLAVRSSGRLLRSVLEPSSLSCPRTVLSCFVLGPASPVTRYTERGARSGRAVECCRTEAVSAQTGAVLRKHSVAGESLRRRGQQALWNRVGHFCNFFFYLRSLDSFSTVWLALS